MIDHASDLAAVFYAKPFAFRFSRRRLGADDLDVMMILGEEDRDALDARAIATARTVRFMAGKDVVADDFLVAAEAVAPDVPQGTWFQVLDQPQRVNDGLEMEAVLTSSPTQDPPEDEEPSSD